MGNHDTVDSTLQLTVLSRTLAIHQIAALLSAWNGGILQKVLEYRYLKTERFPRKENTRGMTRSVRRAPSYQLGKITSDSLSLPASRAIRADGTHHMGDKLTFLTLSLSPLIWFLFAGNPGHGPVFIKGAFCHANYERTPLNLRKSRNRTHRNSPGRTGPLNVAGMFRKRSSDHDVACRFLKNFQVVNDDTSHRGPEASKNVHRGPQLRTERFSIVFGLDLRRQMGVTEYIYTDDGSLDPHPIFEMPTRVNSDTPELA